MARLRILVLGSTGSIGTQTLDLVRLDPGHFEVVGLSAHGSADALLTQVQEFQPRYVALADESQASGLEDQLPSTTTLFRGPDANLEMIEASTFDLAVHGIVGAAGLRPSVAVLKTGARLALANKESLVLGGELLLDLARRMGTVIIPVDSEHCAVHQCLRGEDPSTIRQVILTASGGPFRGKSREELRTVTREQALQHPTWDMGQRITIGSATLMNKALEIIELHHLFGLPAEKIQVAVHPQSVVHSMVEFVDGSVMAQMGPPDMRGPIHFALHYPDRAPAPAQKGFSLELFSNLTFEAPDRGSFPALDMGYECVSQGGTSGAVLNASDEVAVGAFLEGRIPFHAMGELCAEALAARTESSIDVESLLAADGWARKFTEDRIQTKYSGPNAARL
ncbi:MAG: 1-deoxy-D-xylulose-5-phosphate reductoisomerase [Planctomycetota bacterium]|nr:1-deoxy-D-xylulose-5-phosphate reductoisomerase [Planctomycetota bacterium]